MKRRPRFFKVLSLLMFFTFFFTTIASASTTVSNIDDLGQYIYTNMKNHVTPIVVNYTNSADLTREVQRNILEGTYLKDDYTAVSYSDISISGKVNDTNPSEVELTITPTYVETAEQEAYVDQKAAEIVKSVVQPGMTDYQKVAALHDWVVSNVKYDTTLENVTDYTALTKGITVCRGYSMLLYKMLNSIGINTRIVTGTVSSGFRFRHNATGHAWNMVQLNGNWYFVDATNDGLSTDASTKFFLVSGNVLQSNGFIWDKTFYPSAPNSYNSTTTTTTQTSATPSPTTLAKIAIAGRLGYSATTSSALTVVGRYSDNKIAVVPNSQVVWTSSNTNVAAVDSNGKVTLTGNTGTVKITAKCGSLTAALSTRVYYVLAMQKISYSANAQTIQLYKVYNSGALVPVTSGITWTSSDSTIAAVDANGKVTFTGNKGAVVITAAYNGTTVVQRIQIRSSARNNNSNGMKLKSFPWFVVPSY